MSGQNNNQAERQVLRENRIADPGSPAQGAGPGARLPGGGLPRAGGGPVPPASLPPVAGRGALLSGSRSQRGRCRLSRCAVPNRAQGARRRHPAGLGRSAACGAAGGGLTAIGAPVVRAPQPSAAPAQQALVYRTRGAAWPGRAGNLCGRRSPRGGPGGPGRLRGEAHAQLLRYRLAPGAGRPGAELSVLGRGDPAASARRSVEFPVPGGARPGNCQRVLSRARTGRHRRHLLRARGRCVLRAALGARLSARL